MERTWGGTGKSQGSPALCKDVCRNIRGRQILQNFDVKPGWTLPCLSRWHLSGGMTQAEHHSGAPPRGMGWRTGSSFLSGASLLPGPSDWPSGGR